MKGSENHKEKCYKICHDRFDAEKLLTPKIEMEKSRTREKKIRFSFNISS